jgi:hypothetical protein
MKRIIPVFLLPFFIACLPPPAIETYAEAAISAADERVSLSPLISEAKMEVLPDWPKDPYQQKILLNNFDVIWNQLLAEFRRCQKYGLYTMVEDFDNPTFRISIVLTDVSLSNDTLLLPVRLEAQRLRDDQRFMYTLPAKAVARSKKSTISSFHYYGQLLSNYRSNFPDREIVSFFYRHKLEKQ